MATNSNAQESVLIDLTRERQAALRAAKQVQRPLVPRKNYDAPGVIQPASRSNDDIKIMFMAAIDAYPGWTAKAYISAVDPVVNLGTNTLGQLAAVFGKLQGMKVFRDGYERIRVTEDGEQVVPHDSANPAEGFDIYRPKLGKTSVWYKGSKHTWTSLQRHPDNVWGRCDSTIRRRYYQLMAESAGSLTMEECIYQTLTEEKFLHRPPSKLSRRSLRKAQSL